MTIAALPIIVWSGLRACSLRNRVTGATKDSR
jgi:hypothetical protein